MLLTLLLTTTLAAAAPGREAMTPPTITVDSVAVATTRRTSPAATAAPTRYCVFETSIGSRIRTKVCHTADEWIASEGQVPTGRITRH